MTKFKIFGAVVIAMAMATPAFAQTNEVISEPGNFAFFYPNGDLRIGTTRPASAMASEQLRDAGAIAGMRMSAKPHAARAHRASPANY